jgi:hypothetical protein
MSWTASKGGRAIGPNVAALRALIGLLRQNRPLAGRGRLPYDAPNTGERI